MINGDNFENVSRTEEVAGRISTSAANVDNNRLDVEIHFNIIGVPHPQSVNVELHRIR